MFGRDGRGDIVRAPKAREKNLGIVRVIWRCFCHFDDKLFAAGPLYTWQVLEAQSKKNIISGRLAGTHSGPVWKVLLETAQQKHQLCYQGDPD